MAWGLLLSGENYHMTGQSPCRVLHWVSRLSFHDSRYYQRVPLPPRLGHRPLPFSVSGCDAEDPHLLGKKDLVRLSVE